MLEIIALIVLCKAMGKRLRAKGWKPLLMQIAVVVCWFGAMIVAAFAYGVYLAITVGPEAAEDPDFIIYPIMLLAAGLGQLALFGIVHLLPHKTPPPLPGSSVTYDTPVP